MISEGEEGSGIGDWAGTALRVTVVFTDNFWISRRLGNRGMISKLWIAIVLYVFPVREDASRD